MKQKRFAVILAGCGVYDGAEVHESVLTLLAIAKAGAQYECFAPDIFQYHVIDHLTGKETSEKRNVLVESARIARGAIQSLDRFDPTQFDALVLPGGFGVAKNLCTFAIDGPGCSVNPDTEKALRSAHDAGLPIGAMCIAPALIAKVLGKSLVTIGNDISTARSIEKMGATHQVTKGADVVVDKEHIIVTSPCYMLDSPIDVVAKGAENTINALINLIEK